ncbi:MAG: hypothetical protein HY712_01255 [candidate division NC10 bacterium]|nr:hypothetical protein [candidate division NC10 bacterium]
MQTFAKIGTLTLCELRSVAIHRDTPLAVVADAFHIPAIPGAVRLIVTDVGSNFVGVVNIPDSVLPLP